MQRELILKAQQLTSENETLKKQIKDLKLNKSGADLKEVKEYFMSEVAKMN